MNLQTTNAMSNAQEAMSDDAFQQAGSVLSESKNTVREKFQQETSTQINEIIKKLSGRKSISDEEIKLMKIWIVGDAESYIKMENNFQDWLNEYERLRTVLINYENKNCTAEDLLKLHGILEDATRVNYDIVHFLEKKDRIKKFETAVADGLDKGGRDVLAKVLSDKLKSPDY